jgi:hypothetical protein
VEFLRQAIKKEENKLDELDTEISDLGKEAETCQHKVKNLKSTLLVAKTLHTNAEKTFTSLSELSSSLLSDPYVPFPTSPTQSLKSIGKGLSEMHTTYVNAAQAALEQAREAYRGAEEELDANNSLLYRINHSLTSRLELRSQVRDNIHQMKDLIGPRRRIPEEIWSMIFRERVMEDEEEYGKTWRKGRPPFTTLKLTWVCHLWRQIVTVQPSLWKYIALPRTLSLSSAQVDRVKHFRKHLNVHSPNFYMAYGSEGAGFDGVHLGALLAGLPSINRFEAQISTEPSLIQAFLNTIEIPIQDLVLISSPDGKEHELDLALSYHAIKNIKSLYCLGVRPCVVPLISETRQAQLDSLFLTLFDIKNTDLILFLEMSGAAVLHFEPSGDWSNEEETGIEQDVLLTRLNSISLPLPVLKFAFNQHVLVPNLRTLAVDLYVNYNIDESLGLWTSFLSIHERRDNITSLEVLEVPDDNSSAEERSEMLSKFINQLPNLKYLTIRGAAVVPALQGMVDSEEIPSGIVMLEVSGCDSVTEDLIMAFFKAYYTRKRAGLSRVRIFDCSLISKDALQRLSHAHAKLKRNNEKKKEA